MTASSIAPQELKAWLDQNRDIILLDTRNTYEIKCGTFEKAIHLGINSFREITAAAKQLPKELKKKTIVMFCTGGIRCEKASAYFMKIGFESVYQLEGGILKYFKECNNAHYQGNCFVFDWRLALNSHFESRARTLEEPVNAGRHFSL